MVNSQQGEAIRKSLAVFTAPTKPFKRSLTAEETAKMYKHFRNHSWSNIDAEGRIILGGGEHEEGKFYILEGDLELLSL